MIAIVYFDRRIESVTAMIDKQDTAGHDLAFAGIAGQRGLVRSGEVSVRELVETTLARIERLGPLLNCFTKVFTDRALRDADAVQDRVRAGERTPLLGVPIAIKDNTNIAGEVTSYGTDATARPARRDSEVVRRLRAAGAVIVATTTLPELEIWGHFTESHTWGITRNPWDLERSPGGSSGGSAAAVAAGLVAGALGSDGGASIRVPAAMCGIFGLKPQRGRISLSPESERWYGLTTFGGLARSVLDVAIFNDAVLGPVDGDRHKPPPLDSSLEVAARREPRTLRVAVSTKPSGPVRVSPQARLAVEQTAALLRSLGHNVHERDPDWGPMMRVALARHLAGVALDASQVEHPDRLEARTRRLARVGKLLSGRALTQSIERETEVSARLNGLFDDHDILLTPVTAAPAARAGRWVDQGALATFAGERHYVCFTVPWNYTGQPAASVPVGFDDEGLPLAVHLVGRHNDELTLISLAAQLESARPWTDRRPPLG
jgi:amidase